MNIRKYILHRLEVFSATGVILWGLFLLNPFVNSFERFSTFKVMSAYATENEWGGFALVIGLIAFAGLIWEDRLVRRIGMLGVGAFRVFTLMFVGAQTNFAATGVGDFTLWAIMAFLAYYRIDREF